MSNLQKYLRNRGIRQRALAARMSISEPAMSKIVNGRQKMSARLVRDMAAALGVTADEVLAVALLDQA